MRDFQFTAAGTPRPVIRRLNEEIIRTLNAPDFRKTLEAQGFDPVGNSPEACDTFIGSDIGKWAKVAKVAKDAGIQPE